MRWGPFVPCYYVNIRVSSFKKYYFFFVCIFAIFEQFDDSCFAPGRDSHRCTDNSENCAVHMGGERDTQRRRVSSVSSHFFASTIMSFFLLLHSHICFHTHVHSCTQLPCSGTSSRPWLRLQATPRTSPSLACVYVCVCCVVCVCVLCCVCVCVCVCVVLCVCVLCVRVCCVCVLPNHISCTRLRLPAWFTLETFSHNFTPHHSNLSLPPSKGAVGHVLCAVHAVLVPLLVPQPVRRGPPGLVAQVRMVLLRHVLSAALVHLLCARR